MQVRMPAPPAQSTNNMSAMQRLGGRRYEGGARVKTQWVSHQGKRQRLRTLKQLTRGLVVPDAIVPRLEAFLERQPPIVDREHMRLAVLNEGRRLHESTGEDFAAVLDVVLTKFEVEVQAQVDAEAQAREAQP